MEIAAESWAYSPQMIVSSGTIFSKATVREKASPYSKDILQSFGHKSNQAVFVAKAARSSKHPAMRHW
jgi:FMN-dependent NADH-azoreductase